MKLNTRYFYELYKQKGGVVSYQIFLKVMNLYHQKITDSCVKDGLGICLRSNVGFLGIHRYTRKPKVKENGKLSAYINWPESNKLKKKIIEEGNTPLIHYKDEEGKIIGDNGGVPWLCYYTTTSFLKWLYTPNMYLKGHLNVVFKISWSNSKKVPKYANEDNDFIHI